MKERADWLAWGMHFVLGLIGGAACSVFFIRGGRRSIPLIARDAAPTFVIGAALIGAGVASLRGDQLWLGDSYRIIPPDAPHQSTASRRASQAVGAAGVALVLVAVARTLGFIS
jgi:hypothetical protein